MTLSEAQTRKHIKRHTRPYGCTFPRCYIRQGSRSDWKRHEEKQHCVEQSWKCTLASGNGGQCFAYAYNKDNFTAHLRAFHQIESEVDLENHCASMRLGVDGHEQFWCGFCRKVIRQSPNRPRSAREMRWTHIGDHFDRKRHIDEWVCFEFNKPYREITKEERKEQRRKYNEPDVSAVAFQKLQVC
jgi:hypothetical protein